jgi:hypothetical protein
MTVTLAGYPHLTAYHRLYYSYGQHRTHKSRASRLYELRFGDPPATPEREKEKPFKEYHERESEIDKLPHLGSESLSMV